VVETKKEYYHHENNDHPPPQSAGADTGRRMPGLREESRMEGCHTLNVETACQECSHCGFRLLTDAQMDSLRKNTLKAYQEDVELLTGKEISEARKQMGWSQAELATHSGLGSASINRWELGLTVQTEANDVALRRALAPALDGGFQFLHLRMGVFQIQCFTEAWKQGWEVEPVVAQRQVHYSAVQTSCPQACWDSPLAFA
jgi:putative zinc finger/helix-turn-helix YgiT family protein